VRIFSYGRQSDLSSRSAAMASCCFACFHFIEARAQHAHRFGAIFDLRFFVPAADDQARRMCVMRTAEYVVFTDCPPGPRTERINAQSFASILESISSASGSTATVAAEV